MQGKCRKCIIMSNALQMYSKCIIFCIYAEENSESALTWKWPLRKTNPQTRSILTPHFLACGVSVWQKSLTMWEKNGQCCFPKKNSWPRKNYWPETSGHLSWSNCRESGKNCLTFFVWKWLLKSGLIFGRKSLCQLFVEKRGHFQSILAARYQRMIAILPPFFCKHTWQGLLSVPRMTWPKSSLWWHTIHQCFLLPFAPLFILYWKKVGFFSPPMITFPSFTFQKTWKYFYPPTDGVISKLSMPHALCNN